MFIRFIGWSVTLRRYFAAGVRSGFRAEGIFFESGVYMAKRGAKSKYETNVKPYLETIKKKVRQGITEAAIAEALGISVATLNNYKNKHDELKDALTKDKGADILDSLINAGIEAAKGY